MPLLSANVNPLRDLEERLEAWGYTGLTLLAIGLLVWGVLKIRGMLFGNDDREISREELLTRYQALKREGELTDDEYRRIAKELQAGEKPRPMISLPALPPAPPASGESPVTGTDS